MDDLHEKLIVADDPHPMASRINGFMQIVTLSYNHRLSRARGIAGLFGFGSPERLVIGILGENAHNLPGGVYQTKGVRFLPGMAPGYIMRPQLSGCNRLRGARRDRGFPLDKNASLEPIDCEQFNPR
jgi:hypothetical protein